MTARNYLLNEDDLKYLTESRLRMHADYEGDHEVRLALRAMARKLLSLGSPLMTPSYVDAWLDRPYAALGAPVRIENVIATTGFATIRQVFEAGSEYFMRQTNFGARCRNELATIFSAHGLIWPCEPNYAPKVETTSDVVVPVSIDLLNDLTSAAQMNVARFERDHGRLANQGKYAGEYARLITVRDRATDLLKSAQLDEVIKNGC
ncbi:hypothetical protein BIW22_20650 [Salmonella enterica]|nr:hypothetical protein [Salmonella enterica]